MNRPLISLCIPTYGVSEWVFPVLDSIYAQGEDDNLFEVVLTDNGNNQDFKKRIGIYKKKCNNLSYYETNALPFVNEIEAYKKAKGLFIKFINHRTLLLPDTLNSLISFVAMNKDDKPFVYFGNGIIKGIINSVEYSNFNDFVGGLSYWSSWSTGMAFWKDDFDKINPNMVFNELFPHTDILFSSRKKRKYIIDNRILLEELSDDGIPKGRYDLFYAFAVEYLAILLQLVREGDLSLSTFKKIKADNLCFIMEQYHAFVVKKRTCSYILDNYEDSIGVFYSNSEIKSCYRQLRKQQVLSRIRSIITRE